jgi:stage III sporulation protein SpoIIIAA
VHPDVAKLLEKLPEPYSAAIAEVERSGHQVMDIVFELGKVPFVRFDGGGGTEIGGVVLSQDDLRTITANFGEMRTKHRAAIDGTLHRIGYMPKEKGGFYGCTIRVGRDFPDAYKIIEDVVVDRVIGKRESLAIAGPPKMGKTTLLRGLARRLAEAGLVVVVVDKSNEIGGDGDLAHPALGKAIRLKVPDGSNYADMLLEAVENHSADVVIADEISDWKESRAVSTLSRRGVNVIATLHLKTLADIVEDTERRALFGDINDNILVTDAFAMARTDAAKGSDKSKKPGEMHKIKRERRNLPVFEVLVELDSHDSATVIPNVAEAVDAYLNGGDYTVERRIRDKSGRTTSTRTKRGKGDRTTHQREVLSATEAKPVKLYTYKLKGQVVDGAIEASPGLLVERVHVPGEADLVLAAAEGEISGLKPGARRIKVASTREAVAKALRENVPMRETSGNTLAA